MGAEGDAGGLITEGVAVSATFVQRPFTASLPLIWGGLFLAWLREKEYP